jgi:hypothetical protein
VYTGVFSVFFNKIARKAPVWSEKVSVHVAAERGFFFFLRRKTLFPVGGIHRNVYLCITNHFKF